MDNKEKKLEMEEVPLGLILKSKNTKQNITKLDLSYLILLLKCI